MVPFRNRREAGRQLAAALGRYRHEKPLVVGLPRGGVPVAFEVARAFGAPLEVWVVRKLGAPGQPEFGLGAIAEGGGSDLDPETLRLLDVSPETLEAIVVRERLELDRRSNLFRSGRPLPDVRGRTVIVVDDGIATGGTARAAIRAIRARDPARLVLAVPVAPTDALAAIEPEVDELLCLLTPQNFRAVGAWYEDFSQTTDDDVVALLREAAEKQAPNDDLLVDGLDDESSDDEPVHTREIVLDIDDVDLAGTLAVPEPPRGLVIFAHGSGSSRHSPRNIEVAQTLQRAGIATLLFDLLTESEAADTEARFDVALLSRRLLATARWAAQEALPYSVPLGYFGASTGAAAALIAAAEEPALVAAVVSRGGRPDLAGRWLGRVAAPTLLIVGGNDDEVLRLNEQAAARIPADCRLSVIPGASHLFKTGSSESGRSARRRLVPRALPRGHEARCASGFRGLLLGQSASVCVR